VQNEAKLGRTGVYGQRLPSCGAWLARGVKRAKRTQSGLGAREWTRVGGTAMSRRSAIVQNEANFEVTSFQFEVPGVRSERSNQRCSDFTLHTSDFTLPPCQTKPIRGVKWPRWIAHSSPDGGRNPLGLGGELTIDSGSAGHYSNRFVLQAPVGKISSRSEWNDNRRYLGE
jgi:hypothetical protein